MRMFLCLILFHAIAQAQHLYGWSEGGGWFIAAIILSFVVAMVQDFKELFDGMG